ncbi:hypothetical protein B0T10DRAFT_524877 [Thelonectria olida]|uniref:Tyrosinase copper-binding domain-containing protein n=1 Tax=Thelonectria olida TaxID=1576542 RepID=A0A9P8WFI0_9HYPO|nr:hypothetical protein B0T10DRAFT_524877 [Thelonectria olida]
MHLPSLLVAASVAVEAVLGAATPNCGCTKPIVRKEWRTLTTKEKGKYINAVKCLAKKPSKTGAIYNGAKSRFDDFQATHIVNTDGIHFVWWVSSTPGTVCLLPSTRQISAACAATRELSPIGVYWSLDCDSADAFLNSPIFDPVTGFGGNGAYINTTGWNITRQIPGKQGGGCVQTGPLVEGKFTVNMGPNKNTTYNPRCLTRDIAPDFAVSKLNQAQVDWVLEAQDFYEFDIRVEGTIYNEGQSYHGGGHLGVGGDIGEVGDIYSSPGDPLFFMHHANMDRLWNKWQRASWSARKSDISGPDTQFAYPFDFFGPKPYQNITLDYTMNFDKLLPDRQYLKVKEVMDIKGGYLCYDYKE